jgi:LysR family glycine cleavage system transcriptional activator
VAQQVRLLEEDVGAALVERSGRGLRLTDAGLAGAAPLAEGFAALARASRAMRETKGRRFLVINSSASFAATWLVARIGKFKARHPEIDVLLDANPMAESLDSGAVDAMIRWGAGDFPGLSQTLLFKEDVFPVCAPEVAAGPNPLRTPDDLKFHPLLHLDWNPAYASWPTWSDWLKAAGAGDVPASHGVWFNHMSMAIGAAAQGQGVALTSFAIAADELAAGRLVAPFATSVRTPFGYYLLCRPEEAATPRIRALREFLVEEAALSRA